MGRARTRARTRARAPARRAQLSKERWRSSKRPPPGYSRTGQRLFNRLWLPGPPSSSSPNSPPPLFWALSFETSSLDGQASAVGNLGSPPSGFLSLLLLEPRMAGDQCFLSTAWTQASYLGSYMYPHSL